MDIHPELVRAIAEIAYATAKTDGALQEEEEKAFYEIIKKELGDEAVEAINRFELLHREFDAEMIQAYRGALSRLKRHKSYLNDEIRKKFIEVVQKVAESYAGTEAAEGVMIKKFKKDLKSL